MSQNKAVTLNRQENTASVILKKNHKPTKPKELKNLFIIPSCTSCFFIKYASSSLYISSIWHSSKRLEMKEEIFAASTKNREKKRILTSLASCVCEDFPSTLSRVLLVVKLSSIIVSRKNVQKPTFSVNSFQLHFLVFVGGGVKFNSERKKLAIRPCLTLDGKRASWMTKKS